MTGGRISLAITDAVTITGQSDEIALRFYTCYLLAEQWDTINRTTQIEGVSFAKPDSQPFLNLYNKRIEALRVAALSTENIVPFKKVSTNKDFVYDVDTFAIRQRNGSDPYYS